MSVQKIILRSCLSTLAAIFILLVFMVGMLVAVYPETMMNVAYNMGMEESSIWFAERSYKRHDKIDTIAFATTVAIEENMYGKILSCGKKMIADEEFESYCDKKDEKNREKYGDDFYLTLGYYDQYIYAQVSVAQYKKGDKDGAVKRAVGSVDLEGEFLGNNAMVWLLLEAYTNDDQDTVKKLIDVMDASAWNTDPDYTNIRDQIQASLT